MSDEPLLAVDRLSKEITLHLLGGKRVEALREVTFQVAEGEFLAIVGPSGAGKSSLLKCIYRTYLPGDGGIFYRIGTGDWVDLARATDREIIELRHREIRYVAQFLKAPARTVAADVVASPLIQAGEDIEIARRRARELLDALGLDRELQDSYPALFSGGEQQRVNVARALAMPARLLLLDEPTSALDAVNRRRVSDLLLEARRAGATMIGIFHDAEMLRALADRVLVLEAGEVREAGLVDQIDIERHVGAMDEVLAHNA